MSQVNPTDELSNSVSKLVELNKNSGKTAHISTIPVDKTPPIVKNKSTSRARARPIPTAIPINSVGGKTRRKKGNKKQNKSKRVKSKKYF